MANCPTLQSFTAEDMCNENLAGLGSVVFFGRKADFTFGEFSENEIALPTQKGEGVLYKVDCKEEGQQVQGSSLGPNKGYKIQLDFTIEMVNSVTAIIGRALNNFRDLFFIVPDGERFQIIYDKSRNCRFDSDGLKTDSGKAASDDRQTTGSVVLQPVKYPNLYIKSGVTLSDIEELLAPSI